MSFRLSYLIIGILLFSAVILGFFFTINNLAGSDYYNREVRDLSNESQNGTRVFDKTQNITDSLDSGYTEITEDWGRGDALGFFSGLLEVLRLVKNLIILPFILAGDIVSGSVEILGLPAWVSSTILAIVTACIVFAAVAIVRGYQKV